MQYAIVVVAALFFALVGAASGADSKCPNSTLITVSGDGGCHLSQIALPCGAVGMHLRSLGLGPDCHVHITVSPQATYQMVGTLLQSLQDAGGFKVGFVSTKAKQD
jgi:biopolymer transport protein ExbD